MAAVPSPETLIPKSSTPPPPSSSTTTPDPPSSTPPPAASSSSSSTTTTTTTTPDPNPNPNPNPNPSPTPTPTPAITPPLPQFPPSFRPVGAPPQFPLPPAPSSFQPPQNPALQPPGVPTQPYYAAPGQPPRPPYWQQQQQPNGYVAAPPPGQAPPAMIAPPGIPRYPTPYPAIVRPGFPPRPPLPINVIPTISRPPAPSGSGTPVVPPLVRPVVPIIAPTEKPQTTVYVGKIASTVENSFIQSLLELCGPVKSWKPAQNPSDGSLRGFGFCEFESAEGVLRALRLLSKLNLDGQELVLNVNQATREYLERYVQKKTEREKLKEAEADPTNKENESSSAEKQENQKEEESGKDTDKAEGKDKQVDIHKFGIVTEEDKETDRHALEKLKNMIEERLKAKPLPPPPPLSQDGSTRNSEISTKSRDGDAATVAKGAEDKEEDSTSDNKAISENDKAEGSSADRARRHDRSRERDRSLERDRERDLKREKERELERYERERERERIRRERERELKTREAERLYRDRLKEWEAREREKEHQRHYEREKEKERQSKRRREILDQEDESDDDDIRKRRRRSSMIEEKRRKRQWEKEDDLVDRQKEEEEIAEAKKRAAEEEELKQKLKDESELVPVEIVNADGRTDMFEDKMDVVYNENISDSANDVDVAAPGIPGDTVQKTGGGDESNALPEAKQNSITSRKLGFVVASGKKTSVPSIFNEEDEEDAEDKKMRPFLPIDYTEESEAARNTSETPSNLVAAAEYAKRISGGNSKDEKVSSDKDRSRRSTERHKDRVRNDDNHKHMRDESKEQVRERNPERDRDNKKLLDAKQLIDTIPKTKEELFSYDINWAVYDKHELHERMRPWITKKITEFLGEEETSLVDYIVSSTNNHVKASDMLELLQSILDEEAEMFVLKMWRMLIFEIKKVETGLSLKSKA